MGAFGWFFFGEADEILVKEIAKEHKVSEETVKKHYKEMLEAIKHESKD